MTLYFTDQARVAAEHLIAATGLDHHPHFSRFAGVHPSGCYVIDTEHPDFDQWAWSSGEFVLIDVLAALSGNGHAPLYLGDLARLDKPMRLAVWFALGIASGCIADVRHLESVAS